MEGKKNHITCSSQCDPAGLCASNSFSINLPELCSPAWCCLGRVLLLGHLLKGICVGVSCGCGGHSGSGGSSSTLCFCWQLLLDAERHVLRQTVVKRLTECVDLLLLSGKGKNMLRIRLLLPFCTKQELLHVLDLGTPISAAFPAWHGSLFLLIGKWQ